MEKKNMPDLEKYRQLPVNIRAHRLLKDDKVGDVMWSAFFCGAMVLVMDHDRYGNLTSKQEKAEPGDYLVWREDDRGWLRVIKKAEFERTHEPLSAPAPENVR